MTDQKARELRNTAMSDVELKAARDFADTKYNWIRTSGRRRALVVLTFTLVFVYGLSNYFDMVFVTLPALLAYMACLWLLRVSVRGVTVYPDELVDERMRELRGYTYRYAYLGVMVLLSGFLIAYIVNQLLAKPGYAEAMTADQLHDLFFAFFFACLALPSALYAWTEPDWSE